MNAFRSTAGKFFADAKAKALGAKDDAFDYAVAHKRGLKACANIGCYALGAALAIKSTTVVGIITGAVLVGVGCVGMIGSATDILFPEAQ